MVQFVHVLFPPSLKDCCNNLYIFFVIGCVKESADVLMSSLLQDMKAEILTSYLEIPMEFSRTNFRVK